MGNSNGTIPNISPCQKSSRKSIVRKPLAFRWIQGRDTGDQGP